MTGVSAASRKSPSLPPPHPDTADAQRKSPWTYSLTDLSRYVKACVLAERINASIDEAAFRSIVARHGTEGYGSYKYFDKRLWLRAKALRAVELRLEKRRALSVLDLGCGPGYFLYVCKQLGHQVHGLDLPDHGFYNEMIALFRIPRTGFRIAPLTPLPELPRKFDVVSAHQICFNGHKTSDLWGVREWDFLIEDLRTRHLNPGGVIALEFNPEPSVGLYSPELRALFAARGARMVRGRVNMTVA